MYSLLVLVLEQASESTSLSLAQAHVTFWVPRSLFHTTLVMMQATLGDDVGLRGLTAFRLHMVHPLNLFFLEA